jgi:hypothetical protein
MDEKGGGMTLQMEKWMLLSDIHRGKTHRI